MSIFDEFDELIKRLKSKGAKGFSSGYSISVTYGPDRKPIVNVETYGDINKDELRREIEKRYPGAEIRGLEPQPLIWENEPTHERREEKDEKKAGRLAPNEIREVDE
jgi:hypothetical protein